MNCKLNKTNEYSIFPIEDQNIWDLYKKAVAVFWTVEELDFSKDKKYFSELDSNEKHFIKMILCFFSSADALVNNNLMERFLIEIKNPEVKCFYSFQMFIECVHQETYSLMIDNLMTKDEKEICFNAIQNISTVRKKAEWCENYTKSDEPLAKRLIAFAIVEGVFFSGAFASIYWLKAHKGNKIQGLTKSNEFIARDESLHTEFAVYLFKKLDEKIPDQEVYDMFQEAIIIEREFVTEAIPCNLMGINSINMIEYIKFVADRLLLQLGYKKLFHSKNPFSFMEMISMEGKTNFFEHRVSEYSRSSAFESSENDAFDFSTDF